MRRSEALVALAVAALLIISGLAWLFGGWGLIGGGTVLAVFTLFVAQVKGDAPDA